MMTKLETAILQSICDCTVNEGWHAALSSSLMGAAMCVGSHYNLSESQQRQMMKDCVDIMVAHVKCAKAMSEMGAPS